MPKVKWCPQCAKPIRSRSRHQRRCVSEQRWASRETPLQDRALDLDAFERQEALDLVFASLADSEPDWDRIPYAVGRWCGGYWADWLADNITENTYDATLEVDIDALYCFEPGDEHAAGARAVIEVAQRLLDLEDHLTELVVFRESLHVTADPEFAAECFEAIEDRVEDLDLDACHQLAPILITLHDAIADHPELVAGSPNMTPPRAELLRSSSEAAAVALRHHVDLLAASGAHHASESPHNRAFDVHPDWSQLEDGSWVDASGAPMAGRDAVLIEILLGSSEQRLWEGWGSIWREDWEEATPFDLGDGQHRHITATHSRAAYVDPRGCDICFKWALVVIEIHRLRQRRARAHLSASRETTPQHDE